MLVSVLNAMIKRHHVYRLQQSYPHDTELDCTIEPQVEVSYLGHQKYPLHYTTVVHVYIERWTRLAEIPCCFRLAYKLHISISFWQRLSLAIWKWTISPKQFTLTRYSKSFFEISEIHYDKSTWTFSNWNNVTHFRTSSDTVVQIRTGDNRKFSDV